MTLKPVKGYEDLYAVADTGDVFSLRSSRPLKQTMFGSGYMYAHLYKGGRGKLFRVHRLVADAFIPNPCHYEQVNHLNGVKTDNRVENLEWCSGLENMAHARKMDYFLRLVKTIQAQNLRLTKCLLFVLNMSEEARQEVHPPLLRSMAFPM